MKKIMSLILVAVMAMLMSCSDSKADIGKVETISDIQKREGMPVRVLPVVKSSMEKWADYSGDLEGTEQVTVFSLMGDDLKNVNVNTGDIVGKNEVIAAFSKESPSAQYRQARINKETVEKTYKRMKNVFESGGISQQNLDEVEAQYKVAVENFKATSRMIEVKSPIAGVVVDVFVDKGERVGPQTPICKVAKISELKTTIYVDESDIVNFAKGQDVVVTWDALKNQKFHGAIKKISLSADPKKRGFAVEVVIENHHRNLDQDLQHRM